MKKDKLSVFMTNLAMLLALETYNPKKINGNSNIKADCIEIKVDELEKDKIDIPDVSSPVANLPWINDEKFLKAQKQNNANILMAAFCSVLVDPLPGEEFNVHLAAKSLKGTVIPPKEIFSQNKIIGPYTESRGYKKGASYSGSNIVQTEGGGVCKIASTLYNVAVLSDLDIVERHNHIMPVNYVPYGQDATVSYGAKDFKFKNNRDYPILIWSEIIGNRLYIGFYGKETSPKVKWHHNITNVVEAPKYYKKNPNLKEGEEKIIVKGIDGVTSKSWVTIEYGDGKTETKDLGISYYIPLPYIIEVNK
jgi:vancomycin resistance protein VanW